MMPCNTRWNGNLWHRIFQQDRVLWNILPHSSKNTVSTRISNISYHIKSNLTSYPLASSNAIPYDAKPNHTRQHWGTSTRKQYRCHYLVCHAKGHHNLWYRTKLYETIESRITTGRLLSESTVPRISNPLTSSGMIWHCKLTLSVARSENPDVWHNIIPHHVMSNQVISY